MDCLISVVVPIYNVEKYLVRCVDSIINQTYSNLDIILVDDGSPDNCGSICDEYAERDNRVKVIHKENGGLSDARNEGIKIAKGKLITFVDSDDYVAINYVEELFRCMMTSRADLSVVEVDVVNENTPYSVERQTGDISIINNKKAIELALKISFRQSAWGKLYRTEIFNDIQFPKGLLYEDLAIVYNVLSVTKIIAISNAKLYKYEVRPGSIMQASFNINHYNSLIVTDNAMDFVKTNYPEFGDLSDCRRVYSYFTVLRRMLNSSEKNKYKEQIDELKQRINKYSHHMIWKRNVKPSLKLRLISYKISDTLYLKIEDYLYRRIEESNA